MAEKPWSDDELEASVIAYVAMLDKQRKSEKFIKSHVYQQLADRFDRSPKAFEYRAQNISYLYAQQGRRWVEGLKPAKNVGSNIIARLEPLVAKVEGQVAPQSATFVTKVNERRKRKRSLSPPSGKVDPKKATSSTTVYERDPEVVAWVLDQAEGVCERCDTPAPFFREDGTPFLEVHHIRRLADGGPDTVDNAVALCPNCHRELHLGIGKMDSAAKLVDKLPRLHHY